MKKWNAAMLRYAGVGLACLIIALATVRALDLQDIGPAVIGATMLSLLVASTAEIRKV